MPAATSQGESHVVPGDDDAALLRAVRRGNPDAYAELYRRHVPAARGLARQLARHDADADDLVSEAFTKVLAALRNGNGPRAALRPYLLTAVRRAYIDRATAGNRVTPVEDIAAYDRGQPFVDPALTSFERSLVARAYAQLPERWRSVLWHTEIEGTAPRELAPLLGMSPNAVSALAVRARSGLRAAYLAEHAPGDGATRRPPGRSGAAADTDAAAGTERRVSAPDASASRRIPRAPSAGERAGSRT